MNIDYSKALIAWVAAAVLAAGLMALVGPKPAWAAEPNFAPAQHFSVGISPTTVTNADFNGDGKIDLAAQNFGTDDVSVLLGNGNGTFQNKKDFTVGNEGSRNVSVLLGKGDGTFGDKTDFAVGSGPNSSSPDPISLVSSDFNADGKADLAVANSSSSYVSVLIGDGAG